MAYLSRNGEEPAKQPAVTEQKPTGSVGGAIAIALGGWLLFSPAALFYGVFTLLSVGMDSPSSSTASFYVQALFVVASAVGAPLLLALALYLRKNSLWIFGAIAAIPAIIGFIHITTA